LSITIVDKTTSPIPRSFMINILLIISLLIFVKSQPNLVYKYENRLLN